MVRRVVFEGLIPQQEDVAFLNFVCAPIVELPVKDRHFFWLSVDNVVLVDDREAVLTITN